MCLLLMGLACGAAAQTMTAQESLEARSKMVSYSKQFVGVPYRYGGIDRDGMDCSGFIFTVARESIGVQLPRSTSAIYAAVRVIGDSEKEPGDLLFFKTVGGKISHVGLYMGNDQFIHSASDGPNTGVIISSLKESYWSRTYAGAGQFLPATKQPQRTAGLGGSATEDTDTEATAPSSDGTSAGAAGKKGGFWRNVTLDGTLTADWSLFTADRFLLNFRGVTLDLHARYTGLSLQPGLGLSLGYDPQTQVFRVPLVFSLTVLRGLRVYAGPVFSIGSPVEPGTADAESPKEMKASVFPGIIGAAWQTPSLKAGKTEISFVQDIHYSVFNGTDEAALPFLNSLAAGLVFSTGVRVTLPLGNLL